MDKILITAKKELWSFFSSPTAFIFLGAFLFITLFAFFWAESFFARNIADVRPLFEYMPLLLIFLASAMTMRIWSEERRSGTIEFLMTVPVKSHQLVVGKFLACLALVGLALLLTISIPITVSFIGELDWGPVLGAYFASLLLAGAYISIGLFVSARTDNQVVSLIITALISSVFYLLGSELFVGFFDAGFSELLKQIGTGSRFESVSRGVLDLRDVYYYISIISVFLVLNLLSLERIRWSTEVRKKSHFVLKLTTGLLVLNLLFANIWLGRYHLRADLTKGNIYSISDVSKDLINRLEEPLLIRGYFSSKTHPLLAPLVPAIRDAILEFAIVSDGRIRAEFTDPRDDENLEEDANRKYGIKPIPFQFADRHQAELVNSYFHILVEYGDQYEVLGFDDLIEVKPNGIRDLDVRIRNLEYDIDKSIKKVVYGFQGMDHLFASLEKPVRFVGYISKKDLPESLVGFQNKLMDILKSYKIQGEGKFDYEIKDPGEDKELAEHIAKDFGFRPMAMGLFSNKTFYFYMTVRDDERLVPIGLPESLDENDLKRGLEASLKRLAPGFLKTVGLVTPKQETNYMNQLEMQMRGGGESFRILKDRISQNYKIATVELEEGAVPEEVDILLVVSPKNLDEKALFAMDQFLMKGGTVLLATSPYSIAPSQMGLTASQVKSGLEDWLDSFGVMVEGSIVLDKQCDQFPVVMNRNIGGMNIQEIKMVQYAYFPDLRSDEITEGIPVTAGLSQVTMSWVSPITIDEGKNQGRKTSKILESSSNSWTTSNTALDPNYDSYPNLGFSEDGKKQSYLLSAMLEGEFQSFFKDKESPLEKNIISSVIDKSAGSARLVIFASNAFLEDSTLQLSQIGGTSQFLNALQLVENAVDWSVEDYSLSAIRGRGQFSHTLFPMEKGQKEFWEYMNYLIAFVFLMVVFFAAKFMQRTNRRRMIRSSL